MEISKHETLWLEQEGSEMITALGVKNGNSILEFGCGEGRYTIPLSQIVGENGHVNAFEHDEDPINVLQKRLPVYSTFKNVTIHKSNKLTFESLIPDNSIDAVFAFDVLQYIKDWDLLFSSFYRILKKTGFIHIYPAEIPHPGDVDIQIAISILEKLGFKNTFSKEYRMMHNIDMVNDRVYCFSL